MEEKFSMVNDWLESLFPQGVPTYEITDKSIELLLELKQLHESQQKMASMAKKYMEKKTDEYEAEASRIQDILRDINFTSCDGESQTIFNLLIRLSDTLGLQTANLNDVKVALYELHRDSVQIDAELQIIDKQMSFVKLMHKNVQKRFSQTIKLEKQMEKEEEKEKANENNPSSWIANYEQKIKLVQDSLNERKYSPSVSHEEFSKKIGEIERLEEELSSVNAQLAKYGNLPPDEELASQLLAEAKQELQRLDQQIQCNVETSVKLKSDFRPFSYK